MQIWVLVIPLFLSACFIVPHKIDVQQGNYVDQEMMSKLKLDITRSQVLFVLGTPLVTDAFHPDRWDYVYFIRIGRNPATFKRWVSIHYSGDTVREIVDGQELSPDL